MNSCICNGRFPAVISPLKHVCFLSLRPEDEDTLLTLSSKMSEQQKQLADLPDTVKVHLPHNTHTQFKIKSQQNVSFSRIISPQCLSSSIGETTGTRVVVFFASSSLTSGHKITPIFHICFHIVWAIEQMLSANMNGNKSFIFCNFSRL